MTFDEYRINYWRMFLVLEKELVEALDYVELNTNNYATTSIVFSKLLLSVGSEIDNVFRECLGGAGRTNIEDYYNFIINKYPAIINQQVKVNDTTIILKPYDGWNGSQPAQSLIFWQKYNELKHDIVLNAQNASLENVLNAMAGLFIIELYRFDDIYRTQADTFENMPEQESKLFVLCSWEQKMRTSKVKLDYSLYDEESGTYDFQV
ncbi:MAG: hypothetical protein K2O32_01440 [Acetatifactor sp.]|nr:hypothetical protein [Acetatifactor sp.]